MYQMIHAMGKGGWEKKKKIKSILRRRFWLLAFADVAKMICEHLFFFLFVFSMPYLPSFWDQTFILLFMGSPMLILHTCIDVVGILRIFKILTPKDLLWLTMLQWRSLGRLPDTPSAWASFILLKDVDRTSFRTENKKLADSKSISLPISSC